jgi:hypothetical protein
MTQKLKTIDDYLDDFDQISGLDTAMRLIEVAKKTSRDHGVNIDTELIPNLVEVSNLKDIRNCVKQAMEALVDSAPDKGILGRYPWGQKVHSGFNIHCNKVKEWKRQMKGES